MLQAIRRGWPALFMLTSLVSAADADYIAEIQKWRRDFDGDVRTGGWLSLIGRFKIEEGLTTIGSDASSTVKLPPALSTKRLGRLIRRGDKFRFESEPGLKATVDSHPLVLSTMLSTKPGSGRIQVGNLRLSVRAVGEDFYLLAADSQNPAIKHFTGTTWFPIDTAYRVTATFIAYDQPEQRQVPLTHVDSKELFTSTGDVTFEIGGETVRLKTFIDDAELFVMFQDQTNGKETYGGGRFMHAPPPRDGKTVLDFNKAFNPYCSVNAYVMCPIPPAENRLKFKVTAGETYIAHE
ncbi:MAG: DUF1684 domain-containing protein [Methylocella sp.]